ncbi:uncharacterized protein QC764_704285 [Podospora pseudoanserina]|uniref:Uncharacterized protein n=1 Tax=Podospora pseudoanserina TaxID=2609844 RepID=A0ABR0HID3_9PEZI|nr:hypothetical protein QC764_704285 [Podospora pseudoanserina]
MALLNDVIPVFCTAEIRGDVLDEFFRAAYSSPEFVNEGIHGDIAVLIHDTNTEGITHPTNPPVSKPTSCPFKNKTAEEIWDFAQENLRYPIFNRAIAVLDEQTVVDKETCLLVTTWENPPSEQENGSALLTVRSDFRSALVILNIKNLGIGGDEHFKNGKDAKGVIRLYQR